MAAIVPQDDVKALLDARWNASNVTEPALRVINHNDTQLRHDLENSGDLLTVRADSPFFRETPVGNHTYGHRVWNLVLEIWTSNKTDGRDRIYDISEEVRRILHNRRHSMTNFQRILYTGMDEIGIEENEQVWGAQINIELENRAVLLET
jgi:hypothetical protein|tara:strand:- start:187 stop:636 length:450 start_codon:yes stop_codon:yes gene_type:complete